MNCLFEIYIPQNMNDGSPVPAELRQEWENRVRAVSVGGGLTVYPPVSGQWVADDGTLYAEPMIPVRVVTTQEEFDRIVAFTGELFEQRAVFNVLLSTNPQITDTPEPKSYAALRLLIRQRPQNRKAFQAWARDAMAVLNEQVDSGGWTCRRVEALVAAVVRSAKATAVRLELNDLANGLPERDFKTALDGLLRLREVEAGTA